MAERITVVGAGRMGVPIAMKLAMAGFAVDLVDLKARTDAQWETFSKQVEASCSEMAALLAHEVPLGSGWPVRLRRGCGPWLGEADCLFEALPERREVKADAYRELCQWVKPACLIGSTTSSFTPDDLSGDVTHPERFVVAHWLHPPVLIPLVEVAPGRSTAPTALSSMTELLERAGKVPVILRGTPGLVVARLQVLIMNEAARMADEGIAPPAEIDRAVRLGLGFRFLIQGLLAFADTGGIDTLYLVCNQLRSALNDPRYAPCDAVERMVGEGRLGQRAGRGFYDWSDEALLRQRDESLRAYVQLLAFLGLGTGVARADPEGNRIG